jgi:hypothetical protein
MFVPEVEVPSKCISLVNHVYSLSKKNYLSQIFMLLIFGISHCSSIEDDTRMNQLFEVGPNLELIKLLAKKLTKTSRRC